MRDNTWLGCLPEQPDDLNEDHFDHVGLLAANRSVDIEAPIVLPYMSGRVLNQGPLGSCTAFGTQHACFYDMKERKVNDPQHGTDTFRWSELFVYRLSREKEGTEGIDSGAYIKDVISVLSETGAPHENRWAYDVSRFRDRPPQEAYDDAPQYRAIGGQRVQINRDAILTALHIQRKPVIIGVSLYESFDGPDTERTGFVSMPRRGEQMIGGHSMAIYAWQKINGIWVFRSRNQWGIWGAPILHRDNTSGQIIEGDRGDCFFLPEYVGTPSLGADYWIIPKFGSAAELAAGTI